MIKAKKVGKVNPRARGDQTLWKLSEPVSYVGSTEYIITSAAIAMGHPETYIFPADEDGEILKFLEMEGSYKGGLSHTEAIHRAGYEIVEELE